MEKIVLLLTEVYVYSFITSNILHTTCYQITDQIKNEISIKKAN